MIQASELRIGNFFMGIGGVQTVLSLEENTDRGNCNYSSEEHRLMYSHLILCHQNRNQYKPFEIEPIPLSEEVLLKIGFGWNIGKSAMWNEHEFLIGKDNEGFYFAQWQYDSNEDPYPSHIVHVNTLHDLQNLHKIITGKELNTSGLTKND